MKTLFAAVSVLALAASTAYAQPEEHRQGGGAPGHAAAPAQHAGPAAARMGGGRPSENARPEGPRPRMARPEASRAAEPSGPRTVHAPGVERGGFGAARQSAPAQRAEGRTAGRTEGRTAGRTGARTEAPNARPGGRAGAQTARTRSPAVAALRRNVQAAHRYHVGGYSPPAGYAPRRWSYGQRLPHAYFGRRYWLGSYWLYGLFAPPPDLVWVRVGDDALLIDEYTGEIIQVDYGVFY